MSELKVAIIGAVEDFGTSEALVKSFPNDSPIGPILRLDLEEFAASPTSISIIAEYSVIVFVVSKHFEEVKLSQEAVSGFSAVLDAIDSEGGVILSLRVDHANIPTFLEKSSVIDYLWLEGDRIIRPNPMTSIAEGIVGYARLSSSTPSESATTIDEAAKDEMRIVFEPGIDEQRMIGALTALAKYFRASGGAGLTVEFEPEMAEVRDLVYG